MYEVFQSRIQTRGNKNYFHLFETAWIFALMYLYEQTLIQKLQPEQAQASNRQD